MKYTLEQRLDIGRRIYEGEITRFQAAQEYDINDNTARNYMWHFKKRYLRFNLYFSGITAFSTNCKTLIYCSVDI